MEMVYKGNITPAVKNHLTNKKSNTGNKLKKIKKIVQHGTGSYGKGANANAIRRYFNLPTTTTSTQFTTDDKVVIELMNPDNVAHHVGAKSYTALGNSIREAGYGPNYFTIGNEICVNSDGDFSKAAQRSIELSAALLYVTGLLKDDIVRHHDITGKLCPEYYLNDKDFEEFKDRAYYVYSTVFGGKSMPNPIIPEDIMVDVKVLNIRSGPSSSRCNIIGQLKKGEIVTRYELVNGYYHIGGDRWIYAAYTKDLNEEPSLIYEPDEKAIMKVISAEAYVRESNSGSAKIIDKLRLGNLVYASEIKADWVKMGPKGWIHAINLEPVNFRENITVIEEKKMYLMPNTDSDAIMIPKGRKLFIYDSFKKDNKEWFNVRFVEDLAQSIIRFGYIDKK